jgi:hypothetical protein
VRRAYLYDADGNEHVDFHCGFGANVLGHCHPAIRSAWPRWPIAWTLIGAGTLDLEVEGGGGARSAAFPARSRSRSATADPKRRITRCGSRAR